MKWAIIAYISAIGMSLIFRTKNTYVLCLPDNVKDNCVMVNDNPSVNYPRGITALNFSSTENTYIAYTPGPSRLKCIIIAL